MRTKQLFISLMLSIVSSFYTAQAGTPQRQVYLGDPVKITLGLNTEKRLTFPDSGLLWADIKDSLKERLEIQIVQNNVYLTAKGIFKSTRIVIGEEGGSQVYLLDLNAGRKKSNAQRLVIALGKDRYAISAKQLKQEQEEKRKQWRKNKPPETVINALKTTVKSPTAGYKTLFQYAAREVYAPDRLRAKTAGIYPQFINQQAIRHLLRGNQVVTKPVASWRSGSLHITAVSVTNLSHARISLDPRSIRGQWKAALFHRNRLGFAGTPSDNTTLYLISTKRFADVIADNPVITRAGGH